MTDSDRAASVEALRAELTAAGASGDIASVAATARALLRADSSIRQASFVRKAAEAFPPGVGTPFRVALLSSFSIEFLRDPLAAHALTEGLRLETYVAGFNQFRQEILAPDSGLHRFRPDVVILAVEGEALAPALYDGFPLEEGDRGAEIVAAAAGEVRSLLEAFRAASAAPLLLHDVAPPRWRALGILDGREGPGQGALVAALNAQLREEARRVPGVHVVDYAGLVAEAGAAAWHDERMALYARAPIAQAMLGRLAREHLKYLRALAGRTRKCLVLDLDNTLWGGVLGEDGPEGIRYGATYPGSAFRRFQQAVRTLHRRGVLLAVASKNNLADVEALFAARGDFVLTRGHFAAVEAHWEPKEASLRRIAAGLNIGLGHLVFADDNPAECARVRAALPAVTVIQLPPRPEDYVAALLEDGFFDGLAMSDEDRRRGALYAQRDQAETLRRELASVEDYYRQLAMTVEIASVDAASLARAAQLTQKTNQFNATTVRAGEAEIAARAADPAWEVATVRVTDRFGDNGIVGLVMARADGDALAIETFLLSCRVIGRTVETVMLAHQAGRARARGLARLRGRIVPTAKNEPVRDLYARHGFRERPAEGEEGTGWELELATATLEDPSWLTVVRRD
ncbi:MAG: HAD-IIIC family phosphatase [Gemmatimonadetes bacterium]|nr:HAD-IIIC family phosphatase [Gemmatimonadota bacterium]